MRCFIGGFLIYWGCYLMLYCGCVRLNYGYLMLYCGCVRLNYGYLMLYCGCVRLNYGYSTLNCDYLTLNPHFSVELFSTQRTQSLKSFTEIYSKDFLTLCNSNFLSELCVESF